MPCHTTGRSGLSIALMEQEAVCNRGWLSREQFLDLLAATNLVPDPNATEMAIHIGFLQAGWPGLIAGGVAFIVPALWSAVSAGCPSSSSWTPWP